jgi:hypothetical protein
MWCGFFAEKNRRMVGASVPVLSELLFVDVEKTQLN